MRLIDADALKKDLSENYVFYGFRQLLNDFYEALDSAPSIDIVRCRECKYAHMTYGGECKYCDKWSLGDSLYLDGDFFCSYGEREGE